MPGKGVFGYSAIHAQVRALYSTLLTPQEWASLCEASDLGTLILLLKDTAYGPYLTRIENSNLTARRAAYLVRHRLANAYASVIRSSLVSTRPLLTQFYRRFELNNLKAVLRGIVAGASWDRVLFVLFPIGSLTTLPAQAMVEAGSAEAAVALLRGTPYYDTLAHAMKRYTAEQHLFSLEVALDLNYWRTLWNQVNQLSGQDRVHAQRIVGSMLDMNNLMWAIRYRMYYHLSEEEVINYTLASGYRVHDEDIRAIAAGMDIAQVVQRVYPHLGDLDTLLQGSQGGLPELEQRFLRHMVQLCRSAFIGYPFHIGIPLAYVVLNELEIHDLVVLIEAKSAQMATERFTPYLLMAHPSFEYGAAV